MFAGHDIRWTYNRVGLSVVLLDLLFISCLNRSVLVEDSYGLGVVFSDILRRGAHVAHSTPTHRDHLHLLSKLLGAKAV